MYAIVSLDSATAPAFERLAPFDVRHLLYGLDLWPRMRAFGALLMGRPIGLALAIQGRPGGGARDGIDAEPPARLLSLTVAKAYRRIGVGSALLRSVQKSLAQTGATQISCSYAIASPEGIATAEALFRRAGWGEPALAMLQCRADRALLDAPFLRDLPPLPPEYEVTDWVDLTPRERDDIAEQQRRAPWFPPALNPFHFEPELETLNSLALRYRGEVAGWLLTHRTSRTSMQYRCLFVREDLATLGRGLTLLNEAIQRHWRAIAPEPGFGEWSTPASLPAMIRFIRRRLAPSGAIITEQRIVRAALSAESRVERGASSGAAPNRGAHAPAVSRIPLISSEECAAIRTAVHAERARWVSRKRSLPFHTFGASTELDAVTSDAEYAQRAARYNGLLLERFSTVYERLRSALATALGAPAEFRPGWALPGFHILSACRGATLPLAPIHCDSEYLVTGGPGDPVQPVSFSLPIVIPSNGAALNVWDLWQQDAIGLDIDEAANLLDAVPMTRHEFLAGELLLYSGGQYHQVAPFREPHADDQLITLEGHGRRVSGVWQLFW